MQPGSQMSYRDYIVRELVDTERKYVQDLENLYDLKKTLEQKGIIPGDVVHNIFLNINAILDFQRRFLIRWKQQTQCPSPDRSGAALLLRTRSRSTSINPLLPTRGKLPSLRAKYLTRCRPPSTL